MLNSTLAEIDDMTIEELLAWHEEAARLWKLRGGAS